jgi:hypothetical protein
VDGILSTAFGLWLCSGKPIARGVRNLRRRFLRLPEKCADLIVIATRGLGALGRLAVGSAADEPDTTTEAVICITDEGMKGQRGIP